MNFDRIGVAHALGIEPPIHWSDSDVSFVILHSFLPFHSFTYPIIQLNNLCIN